MIIDRTPMGWNSWNTFGEKISEDLIIETAEFIVNSGLRDAGYEYVVIDDCWSMKTRDDSGRLVADPKKFPHGMAYLADKIHALGLKFGMYSCAGLVTCAGYPSSYGYEWIDAKTFAEWGVDYLKYDYCFKPMNRIAPELYRTMGLALANCGRDILFSACNWGVENTHEWIRTTGAGVWRSTGDISDNWESIKSLAKQQLEILPYGGRGCYNDVDMLVVGMRGRGNVALGGCTDTEYMTHFALWCMLQSPLMIGCDLREADEATMKILKNEHLIGLAKDALSAQTCRVATYPDNIDDKLTLFRHLENGDIAIGFFNLTDKKTRFSLPFPTLGVEPLSGKTLKLFDCINGEDYHTDNDIICIDVEAHGSAVFRASVVDRK